MTEVVFGLLVLLIGAFLVAGLIVLSLFQLQKRLAEETVSVQKQVMELSGQVNEALLKNADALRETQQALGVRVDGMSHAMGDIQQQLGRVYEIGKVVSTFQQILQAPKLRGGWSEFFLGDLLAQMLPPQNFSLQYSFKDGERVDAVIRLAEGLISVDAKFPLDNFKRMIEAEGEDDKRQFRKLFVSDVKKRVDEIASRYILPEEGTFDFALMYIPAENVYYETIIRDESLGEEKSIQNYALQKRVFPVSPGSFYAYLSAILHGLNGLKIEAHAQEILQRLQGIQVDLEKFAEEFGKLGAHLKDSASAYDKADRKFEQVKNRFSQVDLVVEEPSVLGNGGPS